MTSGGMTKKEAWALQQEHKVAEREKFSHKPRILLWDIESTGLNATFGTLLTLGWKWFEEEGVTVKTILEGQKGKRRSPDMLDDRYLVEEFTKAFNTADYHVTWYGEGFDLRMLRSKSILYGLPPLAPVTHIDLWKTARRKFKLHSNRLNVWEQFLGVKHAKTPLRFEQWLAAAHGNREALDYIVEHNRNDVLVLEEVFVKMRPWLENVPVFGLFTGEDHVCPACGSPELLRRGYKTANTRIYQQYQCKACGHWSRSREALGTSALRNTIT